MIKMREGTTISRELLVNRFKKVVLEKIKLKNGEVLDWVFMDTPKSVVIVAVTPEEEVVLVDVYRHNLRKVVTELPAGGVEENESSETTARRELLEETGYDASKFISLGSYYVLPTETNRHTSFFLAINARKAQEPQLDDIIERYWEMAIKTAPLAELTSPKHAAIHGVGGMETLFGVRLASDYLRSEKNLPT